MARSGKNDAQPAPAPASVRTIAQGELVGLVADNGAHVWRGLPFAASTAGENRWRAPKPAPGWEGRRETLTFAERCAQLTNQFDRDEGLKPGQLIGSEDCLALDIYAPADAEGKALPVMVWIHGGGNVWGRSSSYDDGGRFGFMDFKRLLGAAHGFEMPFVFNRFQHLGRADKLLFKKGTEKDRERLSRAMGAY